MLKKIFAGADLSKLEKAVAGIADSFKQLSENTTFGITPDQIEQVTGAFNELKTVLHNK